MSETLRSYSAGARAGRALKRRGGRVRWVLAIVAAVVLGHAAWTIRDTAPLHTLIPAEQKYGIYMKDIVMKREALEQSFLWEALPGVWEGAPAMLRDGPPAPDWVLNNLAGRMCFITGNDLAAFSDAVLLTRMTPVGTLLERYSRLGPWSEVDHAGGLRLRKLRDTDVYYAVRGRSLALSASRTSLIHALTLDGGEAMPQARFEATVNMDGPEDVGGTIVLEESDPYGPILRNGSFALRVEADRIEARGRAVLHPELEARTAPLRAGLAEGRLPAPLPGMLAVAGDFGMTLEELYLAVGEATEWSAFSPEQWAAWADPGQDGENAVGPLLTSVLGGMGPDFAITLAAVNGREFVPLPELTAVLGGPVDVMAMLMAMAPEDGGAAPWESTPRRDEDAGMVYIPMAGGPSLEPSIMEHGGAILAATSRNALEDALAAPEAAGSLLDREGNLYLRAEPAPLVEALSDVGRQLAEAHMLRGYTPESFGADTEEWLRRARVIEHMDLLAAAEDGAIVAELTVQGRPQGTPEP